MEELLREHNSTIELCTRQLNDALLSKEQTLKRIAAVQDETLLTLDRIHSGLRPLVTSNGEPTNIASVRDNLIKKLQEGQQARQLAGDNKLELQMQKSILDAKVVDLKKELDRISKENHAIQAELDESQELPLILKLMKSK